MTFLVVVVPIGFALFGANELSAAVRDDYFRRLAAVWGAGFVFGLAQLLAVLARGELILRTYRKTLTNLRWQRLVIAALVAVTIVLILALPHVGFAGLDLRIPLIVFYAGFLLPLMPPYLYVTFRVRPEEMFSQDPRVAKAAVRRLLGNDGANTTDDGLAAGPVNDEIPRP
jgi:hypothetical protein